MEQVRINIIPKVLAFVLWLTTLFIGLVDIYFAKEIVDLFLANFGIINTGGLGEYTIWSDLVVVFGAIIFLGFAVITSEFHLKNVGKRESWDLFTKSLIVELAIPFIAYFMNMMPVK